VLSLLFAAVSVIVVVLAMKRETKMLRNFKPNSVVFFQLLSLLLRLAQDDGYES
jgi:hypothetical protein